MIALPRFEKLTILSTLGELDQFIGPAALESGLAVDEVMAVLWDFVLHGKKLQASLQQ